MFHILLNISSRMSIITCKKYFFTFLKSHAFYYVVMFILYFILLVAVLFIYLLSYCL